MYAALPMGWIGAYGGQLGSHGAISSLATTTSQVQRRSVLFQPAHAIGGEAYVTMAGPMTWVMWGSRPSSLAA